jgi:ABC-type transport system involved in cytochrome c biogenesis permease subunit
MVRSLFLFDMTFWLYLAALILYVAYLFARRPVMALAPAGHSTDSFDERDGAWATQLGQIATLITVFGWIVNSGALFTRAFERMQTSGTFAPWSNQFEAMAYVSWAIILGYVVLELRYKIKAIGAFVVGIGFIAMGAASLLPLPVSDGRTARASPQQLLDLYPCIDPTLTSYAAFPMAGGLGVMYLFKERADDGAAPPASTRPSLTLRPLTSWVTRRLRSGSRYWPSVSFSGRCGPIMPGVAIGVGTLKRPGH